MGTDKDVDLIDLAYLYMNRGRNTPGNSLLASIAISNLVIAKRLQEISDKLGCTDDK